MQLDDVGLMHNVDKHIDRVRHGGEYGLRLHQFAHQIDDGLVAVARVGEAGPVRTVNKGRVPVVASVALLRRVGRERLVLGEVRLPVRPKDRIWTHIGTSVEYTDATAPAVNALRINS